MTEDNKPKLTPILTNLETALKVWWKNLKKFIFVYLWGMLYALVPLAVAAIFFGLDYWQGQGANPFLHILTIIITVAALLWALYCSIRAYLGLFLLVKNNYEGQELEIFKETKKYFWSYLGLEILVIVFVLLWCLLLVIPGIIYGIFYSLAVFVFFFEGTTGLAAIRRSVKLVESYWWPVFGRFVVIGVIAWLVSFIFSVPLGSADPGGVFFQIWSIIGQVVSFLVGPFVLLYMYSIYQDLVKIKK